MLGKPRIDGFTPLLTLLIVGNDMVLAIHNDILYLTAEYAEGIVELLALVGRHIGIGRAMEEQERRVNVVGIEERRVLCEEGWIVPREGTVLGTLAIAIAPKAASPVRGDVADTSVTDGTGEDVCASEEVLGHEAAVGSTYATNLVGIDIGMLSTELQDSLDDIITTSLAPGIDMTGSKLLSET